MIERLSTIILDKPKAASNSQELWDKAIADAEEMIQEEAAHLKQLKRSVVLSKELRDRGVGFPGVGQTGESGSATPT